MAERSPARYVAPLALAGAVTATIIVIDHSGRSSHHATAPATAVRAARHARSRPATVRRQTRAHTYVVRSGDTLSEIATRTGVSVDRLQRLNPGLDPQALTPGATVKLTP